MKHVFKSKTNWLKNPALYVLVLLALIGNYSAVPLVFGVEFIFGSIATLILIATFGPIAGIGAAILASVYTLFLWNHFYGAVVIISEAVFVGLFWQRIRSNLLLATGVFWFCIGIIECYTLYRLGVGADHTGSLLIALKQAANGILNAVLASMALTYTPLPRWILGRAEARVSVFQSIFTIFIAAAIIPACILMVMDARRTVDQVEREVQSKIDTVSTGISHSVEQWLAQHIYALGQLAREAEFRGLSEKKLLSDLTRLVVDSWPDIINAYIANDQGVTEVFYPSVNRRGQSTIGLDFSDREYFRSLKQGIEGPHISGVFLGRGGIFKPIMNVTHPIVINGRFSGITSAPLDLEHLSRVLSNVPADITYYATIIDRSGKVVATTDPSRQLLSDFEYEAHGEIALLPKNYFRIWPSDPDLAEMSRWKNSFLGKTVDIGGLGNLRLIVETPIAPWQSLLYSRYIKLLSYLLILALIVLIGTRWIATKISEPLTHLTYKTTNLPQRLQSHEEFRWPTSRLIEINALAENFRVTFEELKLRFQELSRSQSELTQANRVKDEFLATLSHELRTPLNAILGHAELLKDPQTRQEFMEESIDTIHRNASSQNQMIRDLLDVSAIVSGKLSIEREPIDPRDFLQSAISAVKKTLAQKKQNLFVDIDSSAVVIKGDTTRLQQVVWNLLVNASKFTPEGGEVSLIARADQNNYRISVSDNGKGIEAEFLPHIFDRFRQEDGSSTRKYSGLGLGLSIVQQIVDQHEGLVTCSSAGRGKGTSFEVFIPLSSENLIVSNVEPAIQSTKGLDGLRVMVVDDDSDSRNLTAHFLKNEGATVATVDSAQEGIDKFPAFKPNLIISDIGMPGEDGYAFIKRLHQTYQGMDVPAAALTAFVHQSDIDKAYQAGFKAHISKPVAKTQLIETVKSMLSPV